MNDIPNTDQQRNQHTLDSDTACPPDNVKYNLKTENSMQSQDDKVEHFPERNHKCHICPKSYQKAVFLQNHLKTHSEERPYKCEHCSKTFKASTSLRAHLRTHTGERPFECYVCNKSFTERSNLRSHYNRFHCKTVQYICQYCSKEFGDSSNLKVHLRNHTGERPYPCSVCEKSYKEKAALAKHMKTHGDLETNIMEKQPKILNIDTKQEHQKTHTVERPRSFVCSVCNKSFTERTNLKSHYNKFHSKTAEYCCHYCSKEFGDSINLKVHLHTGECPYCSVCKIPFKSKSGLVRHMKTHKDLGIAGKEEQPKKLDNDTKQDLYLRTHTVERPRPFVCSVCNKSFTERTNLKSHYNRFHSKTVQYICQYCSKEFGDSSNLKVHLRKHTGERPYSCSACEKSFKEKAVLVKHMKTHKDLGITVNEKQDNCNNLLNVKKKHNSDIEIDTEPDADIDYQNFYEITIIDTKREEGDNQEINQNIHTVERRFACSMCNKSFGLKLYLQRHLNKFHRQNVKYSCDHCPKEFGDEYELNNHISQHHSDNSKTEITKNTFDQDSDDEIKNIIEISETEYVYIKAEPLNSEWNNETESKYNVAAINEDEADESKEFIAELSKTIKSEDY